MVIDKTAERQQKKIGKTVDKVMSQIEKEDFIKQLDKLSYTCGLLVFNITAILLFFPNPNFIKNWIILLMISILVYRF